MIPGSAASAEIAAPHRVRGRVDLAFERRGGRTVLARSRVEAPMSVIRPFELADGRLVLPLISLGPGLCGGDTISIAVTAGDGTHVVVTTTSATRILTMEPGRQARQDVWLHAGDGASLEYYPAVTIPFPGSAVTQAVRVTAVPTARVGVVEAWALGRTARDEYLAFRSLSSRTTLEIDGAIVYADAMQIDPAKTDVAGAGIVAGRRYVASGFWHGASLDAVAERERPDADVLVALGQSTPDLVYLRALGDDAPAIDAVVRRSLERVSAGWGLPAVRLDRFRC